ncbi:MAG: 1-acyl-sn-glycerol-3-phosphate acyltransferase [Clostridia bacterium]|nr:1-acyl-sn-glycerol-3-phosphate acyltransferase [Clostridia bacterium]
MIGFAAASKPYAFDYENDRERPLYGTLKPLAVAIIKSMYKINYIGAGNVPEQGGIILAANHITALDPLIVAAGCSRRMHFMSKRELFDNKLSGWFLSQLYAFPVDRSKFDFKAVDYAAGIVKKGDALGIFPEGTRSHDFRPHAAKGGVCYIARECKCDVVPVSIFTDSDAKKGTKLTVRYGEPIKYDELEIDEGSKKMKDLRSSAAIVMDRITGLWELGHEG